MKSHRTLSLFSTIIGAGLFLFISGISGPAIADSEEKGLKEGVEHKMDVLLEFSEEVSSAKHKAMQLAELYDGTVKYVYENTIQGTNLEIPERELANLMANESVVLLSQEKQMSVLGEPASGDKEGKSSGKPVAEQKVPVGMKRINADDVTSDEDHKDVNVAIIDTGVAKNHPDLKKNVKGGVNFLPKGDKNDWGPVHPHGTHVAGIIGARDNDTGVVGVAPKANLYSVRVINPNGEGGNGAIVKGIDWAADESNDIDVANVSLGGLAISRLTGDDTMGRAVQKAEEKGLALSIAAGNSGLPAKMFTPAGYEEGTTVTAINPRNDHFAAFSNFGIATTTVAAPGVQVLSTVPQDQGSYKKFNGTSMAAPHVAGGMALLLGENPKLSPEQVENTIRKEGISVQWKEQPSLSGSSEPLMDASELSDGMNAEEKSGKKKPLSGGKGFFHDLMSLF